jgi:hypothetical protein
MLVGLFLLLLLLLLLLLCAPPLLLLVLHLIMDTHSLVQPLQQITHPVLHVLANPLR